MTKWIGGVLVLAGAVWIATRRFRCALTGGHLLITKYDADCIYESCFRCEQQLRAGWTTQGLKAPRVTQPVSKPRNLREWSDRYDSRKRA